MADHCGKLVIACARHLRGIHPSAGPNHAHQKPILRDCEPVRPRHSEKQIRFQGTQNRTEIVLPATGRGNGGRHHERLHSEGGPGLAVEGQGKGAGGGKAAEGQEQIGVRGHPEDLQPGRQMDGLRADELHSAHRSGGPRNAESHPAGQKRGNLRARHPDGESAHRNRTRLHAQRARGTLGNGAGQRGGGHPQKGPPLRLQRETNEIQSSHLQGALRQRLPDLRFQAEEVPHCLWAEPGGVAAGRAVHYHDAQRENAQSPGSPKEDRDLAGACVHFRRSDRRDLRPRLAEGGPLL